MEIACRDLVDRAREAVDSPRDSARQKESQGHGRDHCDPEEDGKRLEIRGVNARAFLLELRVRVVDPSRTLEIALVPPVECERREQNGPLSIRGQRTSHFQLSLGTLVKTPASIAFAKRVARLVLQGNRDELGVARK